MTALARERPEVDAAGSAGVSAYLFDADGSDAETELTRATVGEIGENQLF